MSRIDAHQHFWQLARGDYGWLRADDADLAPLVRDFLPADLAPLLQAHAVTRTVLVQAAPSVVETDFMLALAEDGRLKGVRPMLQDLAAAPPRHAARPPHDGGALRRPVTRGPTRRMSTPSSRR